MSMARMNMDRFLRELKDRVSSGDNCYAELAIFVEEMKRYGKKMSELQIMLQSHGHSTRDLPLTKKAVTEFYEHLEVLKTITEGIKNREG